MAELAPDLLALLRCPACHGELVVEADALRCDACRLRFRVVDGIPDMLIDDAERLDGADRPAGAG